MGEDGAESSRPHSQGGPPPAPDHPPAPCPPSKPPPTAGEAADHSFTLGLYVESLAKEIVVKPGSAVDKAFAAVQTRPMDHRTHKRLGKLLYRGGHYSGAEDAYREAILIEPDDPSTNFNLAVLLHYVNDGTRSDSRSRQKEAVRMYQKVLELDPDDEDADRELAYILAGPLAAAALRAIYNSTSGEERKVKMSVKRHPKDPEAHCDLGDFLVGKKDFHGAWKSYKTAVDLHWQCSYAHFKIGYIFHYIHHDHFEAKTWYQNCLALDPEHGEAKTQLHELVAGEGVASALRDVFDNKTPEFRSAKMAAIKHPEQAKYQYDLGLLLYKTFQDYHGAEAQFRLALEEDPDHAGAHAMLGVICYKVLRNNKKAEEHFRTALRLNPRLSHVHHMLGNLLYKVRNDFDAAERAYREVLVQFPQDFKAQYNLGVILAHGKHEYSEAASAFRQCLILKPDDEEASRELDSVIFKMKPSDLQAWFAKTSGHPLDRKDTMTTVDTKSSEEPRRSTGGQFSSATSHTSSPRHLSISPSMDRPLPPRERDKDGRWTDDTISSIYHWLDRHQKGWINQRQITRAASHLDLASEGEKLTLMTYDDFKEIIRLWEARAMGLPDLEESRGAEDASRGPATETGKTGTAKQRLAAASKLLDFPMDESTRTSILKKTFEMFHNFDEQEAGLITPEDLKAGFEVMLGKNVSQAFVSEQMEEMDLDGSGEVDFGECIQYTLGMKIKNVSTIYFGYLVFDRDQNDLVKVNEFISFVQAGYPDGAELKDVLREIGVQPNARVSFAEYVRAVAKPPLAAVRPAIPFQAGTAATPTLACDPQGTIANAPSVNRADTKRRGAGVRTSVPQPANRNSSGGGGGSGPTGNAGVRSGVPQRTTRRESSGSGGGSAPPGRRPSKGVGGSERKPATVKTTRARPQSKNLIHKPTSEQKPVVPTSKADAAKESKSWTPAEEQALLDGLARFGPEKYTQILSSDAKGERVLIKKRIDDVQRTAARLLSTSPPTQQHSPSIQVQTPNPGQQSPQTEVQPSVPQLQAPRKSSPKSSALRAPLHASSTEICSDTPQQQAQSTEVHPTVPTLPTSSAPSPQDHSNRAPPPMPPPQQQRQKRDFDIHKPFNSRLKISGDNKQELTHFQHSVGRRLSDHTTKAALSRTSSSHMDSVEQQAEIRHGRPARRESSERLRSRTKSRDRSVGEQMEMAARRRASKESLAGLMQKHKGYLYDSIGTPPNKRNPEIRRTTSMS